MYEVITSVYSLLYCEIIFSWAQQIVVFQTQTKWCALSKMPVFINSDITSKLLLLLFLHLNMWFK